MKLRHFSISQQGDSHIVIGKNCQDNSGTISVKNEGLGTELAIAVIADGVGSCDYSEDGSRIAVTTVLEILSNNLRSLEEISEKTILPLIKKAFQTANENIERESSERELPFLLFDTTLTATVLTDSGACYIGHIGDDGVVALFEDGTYGMITNRIEGEEANSVIPLSSTNNWTFGFVNKPVAALALMTDGLLDKSVGSDRMGRRVYYPFFKPMFENIMETDQDVIELRTYWEDYLQSAEFRKGYSVTDDITLAIVQLTSKLKNVKPVAFDEEKWNRETQNARNEIEKQLEESSSSRMNKAESHEQGKDSGDSKADEIKQEHNSESSTGQESSDVVDITASISDTCEDTNTSIIQQNKPIKSPSQIKKDITEKSSAPIADRSKRDTVISQSQNGKKTATQSSIKQQGEMTSQKLAVGKASKPQKKNVPTQKPMPQKPAPQKPVSQKSVTIISNPTNRRFDSTQKDNSEISGNATKPSNDRRRFKFNKRVVFSIAVSLLLLTAVIFSTILGYNRGITKGKQQGQQLSQQEILEMQETYESELEKEYQRGYDDGMQEAFSESKESPVTSNSPESVLHFILTPGQKGDHVEFIQQKLKEKGWTIETDQDYGPQTEKAVREFQTNNHLPSNGKVDIYTFWMLMNENSIGYEPSIQLTPAATTIHSDSDVEYDRQDKEEKPEDETLDNESKNNDEYTDNSSVD